MASDGAGQTVGTVVPLTGSHDLPQMVASGVVLHFPCHQMWEGGLGETVVTVAKSICKWGRGAHRSTWDAESVLVVDVVSVRSTVAGEKALLAVPAVSFWSARACRCAKRTRDAW